MKGQRRSCHYLNGGHGSMGRKVVGIAGPNSEYDLATEELRSRFEAEACIMIVISGNHGTGVSMKMPDDLRVHIPSLFRALAREWEDVLTMERSALLCPVCRTGLSFDPRHPLNPSKPPRPGCMTVCVECASFITLDASMTWRVLTDEELAAMPDDCRISLIRTRREIERSRRI